MPRPSRECSLELMGSSPHIHVGRSNSGASSVASGQTLGSVAKASINKLGRLASKLRSAADRALQVSTCSHGSVHSLQHVNAGSASESSVQRYFEAAALVSASTFEQDDGIAPQVCKFYLFCLGAHSGVVNHWVAVLNVNGFWFQCCQSFVMCICTHTRKICNYDSHTAVWYSWLSWLHSSYEQSKYLTPAIHIRVIEKLSLRNAAIVVAAVVFTEGCQL